MQISRGELWTLRAAALAALLVGLALLLASWDSLYRSLDLPQPIPSLLAQLGGAAFIGFAWLLLLSASRPESFAIAASAGAIAMGGGALAVAGWLIFRDTELTYYGVDTLGTVIMIVVAVTLGALALAQALLATRAWRRPAGAPQQPEHRD